MGDLLIERLPVLSLFCFGAAQIPLGVTNIVFVSTLQELLPVEMVGRVFSAIAGAVSMAGPLGALLGGFLGYMFGSSIVYSLGIWAMLPVSNQWFIDPLLRNIPNPRKMDPVKYGLSRHTALNR